MRRGAERAYEFGVVIGNQCHEGVDDGAVERHVTDVDELVDFIRREIIARQHPARLVHLHHDGLGANAVEQLLNKAFRHHVARRGVEHQRGGMRRCEAIIEPHDAEIRDRRHVDHDFRDHHEQCRQQQQLARQAKAAPARAGWRGRFWRDGWCRVAGQCASVNRAGAGK